MPKKLAPKPEASPTPAITAPRPSPPASGYVKVFAAPLRDQISYKPGRCTTCGTAVAQGATCIVDGTVAK